jgi:hypothetical protein
MKKGVSLKRKSAPSPLVRQTTSSPSAPQINLSDKLIETIRNLTSNKDLLNTRISLLNGEGLRTASIMEIAGMYRSLVSQVAILYDTDDFQKTIAPFIENRFKELGSPSLTPGTIGSYIFGCYLTDYGMEDLSKFCTPICAASIRYPNRERVNMRCREKVIWTDGGDTPVFILIDEDPSKSSDGKVFIPWLGSVTSFVGLTQGAIDEIRSMDISNIEIYGQLYNNKYVRLMEKRSIDGFPVVERIRIRSIDFVNGKNGGENLDKISMVNLPKGAQNKDHKSPPSGDINKSSASEEKAEKKSAAATLFVILLVFFALMLVMILFLMRRNNSKTKVSPEVWTNVNIPGTPKNAWGPETATEPSV